MDQAKHIAKLHKKICKHFAEFLEMPVFAKNFRDGPPKCFQAYLDGGTERAVIATSSDELSTWHFSQYANAVVNEGNYPLDAFALAARYAHATVKFEEAFAAAGRDGSLLLRTEHGRLERIIGGDVMLEK